MHKQYLQVLSCEYSFDTLKLERNIADEQTNFCMLQNFSIVFLIITFHAIQKNFKNV